MRVTWTLEPMDPKQPHRRRLLVRNPVRPPPRTPLRRLAQAVGEVLALSATLALIAYACVWALRLAPYIGG